MQAVEIKLTDPLPVEPPAPLLGYETTLTQASEVWGKEKSSPLDVWHTFNHPYRRQVTEQVSRFAPQNGTVGEVGCGMGINLFWLSMFRPDLNLYGVDVNQDSAQRAKQLVKDGATVFCGNVLDFPLGSAAHVLYSVYAAAYLLPSQIADYLAWAKQITHTVIFAEPTVLEASNKSLIPLIFNGKPLPIYHHPYPELLRRAGWHVEVVPVPEDNLLHHLNAITIGTQC